jgi:hypothetical protein
MSTPQTENAIALYNFNGDGDDQLTIVAGNQLIITDKNDEWAYGYIPNKSELGWFPLNYIEIIPEKPVPKSHAPPPPIAPRPRKSAPPPAPRQHKSASPIAPRKSTSAPKPPPQSDKPRLIPLESSSLLSELKKHVVKQTSERQVGNMSHHRNRKGIDIIKIVPAFDKIKLAKIYKLLIDTLLDLPGVEDKEKVNITKQKQDVIEGLNGIKPLLIQNKVLFDEIITIIDRNSSELISTFLDILYNKIDRYLNPEKYEGMFRGGSKYSKKRKSKSKKNKTQVKHKTRKL